MKHDRRLDLFSATFPSETCKGPGTAELKLLAVIGIKRVFFFALHQRLIFIDSPRKDLEDTFGGVQPVAIKLVRHSRRGTELGT